ncbi:DUF177 domain-containing protein [Accumulibacter sp.]|uniref:YceD family protein n=1 Tax=Accumulibacter sp. TaxID=2053492 RepID=UPI0025CBADE7|nr:YceD family protein [Accumulibacter sp.]MCM8596804.1 YceD family protein [Accumulibacter sp.]MCM8624662.1 YceD family protein [Accumulibacter sp.]MDS4050952.1 YceD family protein [Accumulibacter sp.]
MSQRTLIDSDAFCREGGVLHGEVPVATLTRLFDLLADPAGSLVYRLAGGAASRGRGLLVVEVQGVLALCCQRCLEAIEYPLRLRSLIEFVEDEDDLTQEQLEDDSRDFLPHQKALDVESLIEDEILLALPVAPRHDDCHLPVGGGESERVSPFSVLAGMAARRN